MTDFATLGIKFESSGIVDAERKLTKLGSTGRQTETKLGGLSASGNKLSSSFKAADTQTNKLTSSLDASNSKASLLSGTMGKLSGVFAGLGLASLASDAFSTYRSFESMNASLKTVTGSAEAAGAAFKEISEFAKTTPYTLDQSVQGFQKLKALGLDPSMTSLKSYGNTAAAMGKDLMQMIEAVADASTGEFERLKEFGIKSASEGDKVSFTFQGVTKTVAKNSAEIQQYLLDIGNTQFATAMSDQMATIDGKIANLSDSYAALQVKLMQSGGADIAAASIETLSSVIQSITDNTREWGIAIGIVSAAIFRTHIAAAAAYTLAQVKLSTATAATTLSALRQAPALLTAAGAMNTATFAANGLKTVIALLGGPLGLIALATGSVFLYREEILKATTHTGRLQTATETSNTVISDAKNRAYEYANASESVRQALVKQTKAEIENAKAKLKSNEAAVALAKSNLERAIELDKIGESDPMHVSLTDTRMRELRSELSILKEQEKAIEAQKKALENYGKTESELNVIYGPPKGGAGSAGAGGYTPPKPPTITGGSGSGGAPKISDEQREIARLYEATRTPLEKLRIEEERINKLFGDSAKNADLKKRALAMAREEYNKAIASTQKLTGATGKLSTVTDKQSDAQRAIARLYEETRTPLEKLQAEEERLNNLFGDNAKYADLKARGLAKAREEYQREIAVTQKSTIATKEKTTAGKEANNENERTHSLFAAAAEKIGLFTARLTKSKEGAEKYALSLSEKLNPAQTDGLYLLQKEGNALEKNYNLREKVRATIADLAKEQKLLNVELLKGKEAAKIEAVKQENEGISDKEARAIVYKQNDIELTRKQISLRGTASDLIKEQNTALYKSSLLTTQGAGAVRLYELAQQGLNEKQSLAYVENEKRLTQSEKMRKSISDFQDGFTDALLAGEDGLKSFFATMIQQAAQAQLQLSLFGESGTGGLLGGLFSSSSSSGGLSSIVSSIFGGFRAKGGSVSSSKAYVVGEEGPELFVPTGNGSIVSNGALSSSGSASTNVTVNLIEDSSKAGTTESSTMNGQQIIDVFVSNIRAGGQAASAIESTYKMKRAGAF